MGINKEIKRLIQYGIKKGLIEEWDEIYVRNRLIDLFGLHEYEEVSIKEEYLEHPQTILDALLDYAYGKELLPENTEVYRDLLDTKIMDCLMARPSDTIKRFYENYKVSPALATKSYYEMAEACNYIRKERISKNLSWKANTEYGELEVTINLAKPEKDPKVIAAAQRMPATAYPKCLLCKENEGYGGRINHPARHNHRVIPVILAGEEWFFQFSPYVYYPEHSIVFKGKHEPMKISELTFERLLEFVEKFPHYFIGSNADLPIVGGSILAHDHFQAGHYEFAMERAPILKKVEIAGYEDVEAGIVRWPLSVIRIRSEERQRVSELATKILEKWRVYNDESVDILSSTHGEPHNTITPIARYKNNKYEMDLVLRNNRTSQQHPMGIFHPHSDLHHIKKENIGLIEVMGLAVLPDRLIRELEMLKECLLGRSRIDEHEELHKHREWFQYLKDKYHNTDENYEEILKYEVGKIFKRILVDAGVFKQDEIGMAGFQRFVSQL